MPQRHSSVDGYIAAAAPFAQPILARLRAMVHAACPGVDEAIKWGAPSFTWRGTILCSMAAFQRHVAFGFWQGERVLGGAGEDARGGRGAAMGQFGRITRLEELPTQALMDAYLARAMALVEEGSARSPARAPRPALEMPADFAAAIRAVPAAQAAFDGFAPGQRRDYIEWIVEARRADTRARRIAQAVEWIAEGRPRHWKYAKR